MGAVRVGIRACGIWFRGPYDFANLERIKDRGGIYVVAAMTRKRLRVLDVGQSKQLRTRLSRHEREEEWLKHTRKPIFFVHYTNGLKKQGRCEIERMLRLALAPPCGKR